MRCLVLLVAAGCGDNTEIPLDAVPDASACTPGPGWTTAPDLPRGPTQETVTVAVDGTIYVIGGFVGGPVDAVQAFDTRTCAWSEGPALPRAIHHANAAVVDGTIWVLGALESLSFTTHGHVWSWNPATETAWTTHPAMPAERGSSVLGVVDGQILVAGGLRNGTVQEVSRFDPAARTWTTLPALPDGRDHACGGVIGDAFYVAGGRGGMAGGNASTLWALLPGATSWTPRASMPTGRSGTACAILDDRLYVFGGEGNPATPTGVFAEAEVYDPAADAWTSLASMPVPRHGMGAAAWDGRIYVPGGATVGGFGAVATHEVFTP